MKSTDFESGNQEEIPIVVDAYGIKVKIQSRPNDGDEELPANWRDVPRLVNQHLMRIAVAPTRLLATVLESASRLAQGIARLPVSIASRMERAHSSADVVEAEHQQLVLAEQSHDASTFDNPETEEARRARDAQVALERVQSILKKYSVRGFDAYVLVRPNGHSIVVVGAPPESEKEIIESVEVAQKLLDEKLRSANP